VKLAIDMSSASFGTVELDMHLPKPVWFDAAKFPQATFQSTHIKAVTAGRYEVVQADHIHELVFEVRIAREFEGAAQVRLDAVALPDAPDSRRAQLRCSANMQVLQCAAAEVIYASPIE
jgi:hypothetical protein